MYLTPESNLFQNCHLNKTRANGMELRIRFADLIESEAKSSRLNTTKINTQWRKIMRLAKLDSLREEVGILAQVHTLKSLSIRLILITCKLIFDFY